MPNDRAARECWPALLAAVTDAAGTITGVHRTWLARDGAGKAPIARPRRAMGQLLGNGVRFGTVRDVLAAGEGIETALSLRCVMPRLPMIAALSANHLAALELPPGLRQLYIVCDNDDAGRRAAETLAVRAAEMGIERLTLMPTAGDFNDDLRQFGRKDLASSLRAQIAPDDVARFLRRSIRWARSSSSAGFCRDRHGPAPPE